MNFFTFLAREVREYLAELGYTKLDDIIGRTDLLMRKLLIISRNMIYWISAA